MCNVLARYQLYLGASFIINFIMKKNNYKIVLEEFIPRDKKLIIEDIKALLKDKERNYVLIDFYNLITKSYES